jgi:hypothetical protein
MKVSKILFAALIFSLGIQFTGCSCNCNKEENSIKGFITVVGNEPFTKVALRTDDNKILVLQCSKELKEILLNQQGSYYFIQYSAEKEENGIKSITVDKVLPIKKENKTN